MSASCSAWQVLGRQKLNCHYLHSRGILLLGVSSCSFLLRHKTLESVAVGCCLLNEIGTLTCVCPTLVCGDFTGETIVSSLQNELQCYLSFFNQKTPAFPCPVAPPHPCIPFDDSARRFLPVSAQRGQSAKTKVTREG